MYVDLFSSHPLRTSPKCKLWVAGKWYEIATAKAQGERWLMSFAGMDDRNIAERMTNSDVYGEPIDDPSVVWVHQLVGSSVVDAAGNKFGTCVGVIDNPAHPIMELDNGSLVPTPFIQSQSEGVVVIDPPEGLFDAD
jgi:16S rRNA processing protein RimM